MADTSEVLQRSICLHEHIYTAIGQGVLEGTGMSLIDLVEQEPSAAYRIIIDHVIKNAENYDRLCHIATMALTETRTCEGESNVEMVKRSYLEEVSGQRVAMHVYLRRRPSPRDILTGRQTPPDEILSFEADLSKTNI